MWYRSHGAGTFSTKFIIVIVVKTYAVIKEIHEK